MDTTKALVALSCVCLGCAMHVTADAAPGDEIYTRPDNSSKRMGLASISIAAAMARRR